jgi:hypothetical protein
MLRAEKKITVQRFGDGDLIPLRTKLRFTTLVVFPEGEEIAEVTCGDKEYWVIDGSDNILHVKPAKEGAVTNLNVVLKSKAVYSFLLREITGPKNSKDLPDLKVEIGGTDPERQMREREMLEAALARAEQMVKETKEKLESEAKKQDARKEVKVAPEDVASEARRLAEAYGHRMEPSPTATPELVKPAPSENTPGDGQSGEGTAIATEPSQETLPPIARTYAIERQEGLIRSAGRAIGRFFRGLNRKLRLF